MSNLPLQPLVWSNKNHARSAFHDYLIDWDQDARKHSKAKYVVKYGEVKSDISFNVATGFATIDEAKQWAWKHYNEKMQPYVKPMPTWIDVNERLPEQNTEVLVRYHAHFDDEDVKEFDVCTAFFYGSIFDVKDQHFYTRLIAKVTHWMPIPEFSLLY